MFIIIYKHRDLAHHCSGSNRLSSLTSNLLAWIYEIKENCISMSRDIIPSFGIRQVVFESDVLLVAVGVGDLTILYCDRSLRCP